MIRPEQVAIGDRIELVEMPEDPDPIPPGTQGTVDWVKSCPASRRSALGGTTGEA